MARFPSPRALTAVLAHSVCHAPHADLSLTNKLENGMMDSDSAVTCSLPSPLIAHQLAYLSINLSHDIHVPQIMYRLSSQLIQPPVPLLHPQLSICHIHCPPPHPSSTSEPSPSLLGTLLSDHPPPPSQSKATRPLSPPISSSFLLCWLTWI